MPDINLSSHAFFPWSDGDTPDADDANTLLYNPAATPDSLEVLNGRLTRANLASAALPLDRELIRPGHLTFGGQVGMTANADYPGFLFGGVEDSAALLDDDIFDSEALPVVGVRFYIPEGGAKYVRLHWGLGFLHDGGYDGAYLPANLDDFHARARLFLDGQAARQVTRDIREAQVVLRHDGSTVFGGHQPTGMDSRWWTGSLVVDAATASTLGAPGFLNAGWHTATLRVATQVAAPSSTHNKQLRVRARRMGYTVVK